MCVAESFLDIWCYVFDYFWINSFFLFHLYHFIIVFIVIVNFTIVFVVIVICIIIIIFFLWISIFCSSIWVSLVLVIEAPPSLLPILILRNQYCKTHLPHSIHLLSEHHQYMQLFKNYVKYHDVSAENHVRLITKNHFSSLPF